jgi:DNA-directed RNA polymerase specialized sigma24 family protein
VAVTDPASFDALLAALDPDREAAAHKYEDLRQRLMRVFRVWGSAAPDRDTDITIDRVAVKLAGGEGIRNQNPYVYFYGVAKFVFKEQLRARSKEQTLDVEPPAPSPAADESSERRAGCLDQCLGGMKPDAQSNILDYYDLQERARIERRKNMADRLGISMPALRIRMQRERDRLRDCVIRCMRNETALADTSR